MGAEDVGGTPTPDDVAEKFARDALQHSIRQDGNNAVFPIDGETAPASDHDCDGRGLHKMCAMTKAVAEAERAFAPESLVAFQSAARRLKAAESAVAEARTEYAEAVKRLSEEAVR